MTAFTARSFTRSRRFWVSVAAGIFLSGCAMDPVPDIGRSTCRANSVAYCEVDRQLDLEQCQCVWRGSVQSYLRDFSRL